jgi:hypothetical protein
MPAFCAQFVDQKPAAAFVTAGEKIGNECPGVRREVELRRLDRDVPGVFDVAGRATGQGDVLEHDPPSSVDLLVDPG